MTSDAQRVAQRRASKEKPVRGSGRVGGRVRVGIIGLGRSGWNLHAAVLPTHFGFQLAAVADQVPRRRTEAREKLGCAAFEDPAGVPAADVDKIIEAAPEQTARRGTAVPLPQVTGGCR